MSGIQGYVTAFRTCPRVRPLLRLFRQVQALGDKAVFLHFYLVTKNLLKRYLNFSTVYINIQGTYLFSYYKPIICLLVITFKPANLIQENTFT